MDIGKTYETKDVKPTWEDGRVINALSSATGTWTVRTWQEIADKPEMYTKWKRL